MTENFDVSIIICAYTEERWRDLVAAVESVQRQSASPREIIVVIDHNVSLLERTRAHIPGITVIENKEPRGSSGARNSGIAVAQGIFIALLDDDAIAESDWLERLNRCCAPPQVMGVGGKVEPLWASKEPIWFPKEFYWAVGCSYRGLPEVSTVVRNLYCGCAYFRRELFESIGGFRNGIGRVGTNPMSCEETELCIRAQQHWPQKCFLYEPQARIYHSIPSYRTSWRYFLSRCYAEGRSKALIARLVGVKDSLASERTYTLRTLPSGVLHEVRDVFLHFDLTGFLRAGSIIIGLTVTTMGYVVGSITQHFFEHESDTGDSENFKLLLQHSTKEEIFAVSEDRDS